ncbi:FMN phosphatase YigB, HAD superfamily [Pseudomonas agarici]|nr:HAD family hydrolase [Pseudomonas agarici]SEK58488.1 FMN phosphatase YigB, HAD superfamily [Pseudomonas agarici]
MRVSHVQAVIFDAFGTVIRIENARHPFRQLLKLGIAQGRRPRPDDASALMSHPWSLAQAADHFGIDVPPTELARIQSELDAELADIQPFADALSCIGALRAQGMKVAICSNLAQPYGTAVERIFPDLEGYGFSYEIGTLKPDRRIYDAVLTDLAVDACKVWMIGDSQRCDRDGPIALGIKGHYLNRTREGSPSDFHDLMAFKDAVLSRE